MSEEAHILYTNTKKPVGLERVIAMIQSSEQSFLTEEDRLIEESKFEKWFTAGKIASGLTFLFSLMGILLAIVMFCYCCRQNTIKSLLAAAVATADQVPKASASDTGNNITIDMTYRLYVMSAFIIFFLLYKFYKWIYKNYISLQILMPIGDSNEENSNCHIYLELTSSQYKVLLYVSTVRASVVNVKFGPYIEATEVKLRTKCLQTTAGLTWADGFYYIYGNDTMFTLPHVVHVPFIKVCQVRKVLSGDFTSRVLVLHDVYYAVGRPPKLTFDAYDNTSESA